MSHQAPPPYPDHDPHYQPKHRAGDPPPGEPRDPEPTKKTSIEIDVAPSSKWLSLAFLRRHPTILLTMLLIVAAIVTMFVLAVTGPS